MDDQTPLFGSVPGDPALAFFFWVLVLSVTIVTISPATFTRFWSPPNIASVKRARGINVQELIFDFAKLNYISSAGLRVILNTQQDVLNHGEVKIINVDPLIMDIFDATGFSEILDIK